MDTSTSEQSADTVIYVGPADPPSDGEHPPVYIPNLDECHIETIPQKNRRGSLPSAYGKPKTPNHPRKYSPQNYQKSTTKQTTKNAVASPTLNR